MVVDGSLFVVLAFGVLISGLSAWGMMAPRKLLDLVARVADAPFGFGGAVGVRLVLGVALIAGAPASRFPLVFTALGWIAIIAAVGLVLLGRERLRRFIAWYRSMSVSLVRLWLLLGLAFGGFMIYGAM